MARDKVQGIAEANAMFDIIPTAAQQELVVELGLIGCDVLKLQEQHAPVQTGRLFGALGLAVLVDRMRVRIGLINSKLAPYYGRIVEFGRDAQTVTVERRRRVAGKLLTSNRRKRAQDISATYALHVKARAPHPYVDPPDIDLDAIAAARLADYWANVLDRAGVP
uniref:hypothetical protein n=1 Tax=uncultured Sphingomonas sp. TaxID=158754 RepID=UPI0035CB15BA